MENHKVYSSKAFAESDRLNEASIVIFKRMRNLPDYSDFNENIRMNKKAKAKEEVVGEGLETLNRLRVRVETELKDVRKEIESIKAPNRSSADIQSKLYGQMLINRAYNDFTVQPNDIHQRLKSALELKENEYLFEIKSLYLNDKNTSDLDKIKVKNFVEELEEQLGLPELEQRKDFLDAELIEVREYLSLLNDSPELFEARMSTAVKVAKRMDEHGVFEGSSILLS